MGDSLLPDCQGGCDSEDVHDKVGSSIPGTGFNATELKHAAIAIQSEDPLEPAGVREERGRRLWNSARNISGR